MDLRKIWLHAVKHAPCLWKHDNTDLTFSLMVDDFGTKHTGMKQGHHLLNTLKDKHETKIDWTGSLHTGVTLELDSMSKKIDVINTRKCEEIINKKLTFNFNSRKMHSKRS